MDRRRFVHSAAVGLLAAPPLPAIHRFSGSPETIGFQHGKALRAEIRQEADPALAILCRQWKLSRNAALRRVVSRFEGVFRELVPRSIDEMRGIAEGAQVPYPYAFYAGIRDLMPVAEGCTAVICGGGDTATGHPIIGQTKDTSAPLSRYHLILTKYDSGFRAVSLAYPGWMGNICLNEHGVSWTGNTIHGPAAIGKLHPASLLKRLFFECRNVREALDKARGIRFGNGCFCAADREGTAICMEWVQGECDVREIGKGCFGHANSIIGRFRDRDESPPSNGNSMLRQNRIDTLLAGHAGTVSVSDFERWFRDHEHHPRSICRHPNSESPDVTTAAFIADLGKLEFRAAVGNPCQAPFRGFRLEEI